MEESLGAERCTVFVEVKRKTGCLLDSDLDKTGYLDPLIRTKCYIRSAVHRWGCVETLFGGDHFGGGAGGDVGVGGGGVYCR